MGLTAVFLKKLTVTAPFFVVDSKFFFFTFEKFDKNDIKKIQIFFSFKKWVFWPVTLVGFRRYGVEAMYTC